MNRSRIAYPLAILLAAILTASCGSAREGAAPAASAQTSVSAQTVDVATVISQKLNIRVRLPAELSPYEEVAIYPKVTAFVKWLGVDRGSGVKEGQLIARLEAPELVAQRAEAESKVQSAESQLAAAQAKLVSDESTYNNLAEAAKTPGVVAGNDLVIAQKAADADRATVQALQNTAQASREALHSVTEVEAYLQIKAPFDGVVTERNVHPGALVGPSGGPGAMLPMLRIQTVSRLRLTVPVPEADLAGIPEGTSVDFTVPAFPNATFHASIARISHAVDLKTRTMPVELDVTDPSGRLTPGSFCEVEWRVRRAQPTLFVPSSAVATNLERTFVIRVRGGKTEWVDVKTAATSGDLMEVFGDLRPGDQVVLRASDALRPGTPVSVRREAAAN